MTARMAWQGRISGGGRTVPGADIRPAFGNIGAAVIDSGVVTAEFRTELIVKAITLSRHGGDPTVLLQETEGDTVVAVSVGPSDASSIIVALEQLNAAEVTPSDLLVRFFLQHHFTAECVDVALPSEIAPHPSVRMSLHYRDRDMHYRMVVRSADAIMLSIRMRVPMLVARAALLRYAGASTVSPIEQSGQDVLLLGRRGA